VFVLTRRNLPKTRETVEYLMDWIRILPIVAALARIKCLCRRRSRCGGDSGARPASRDLRSMSTGACRQNHEISEYACEERVDPDQWNQEQTSA
jgi:hypothetical protein